MKNIIFILAVLYNFSYLNAQTIEQTSMNGIIKYCIEDYFYRDSLLSVEGIWVRDRDYKYYKNVNTVGLPRNFDYSSMPEYTFHDLSRRSIRRIQKRNHSKGFSSMNVSIDLVQDTLFIKVWSVGVSRNFLSRFTHIMSTDNGRLYQFNFNQKEKNWVLSNFPKN